MANARIRLNDQVIEQLDRLGQECGIDDHNVLIKLLIRKYGSDLARLLSPDTPTQDTVTSLDPKRDSVSQPVLKAFTAVPHVESVDFASLIANA